MTSTFFLLLILYRINMPLSSVNIVLCVTLGGNILRSGSTFPKESINISTAGTQAGSCICYLTQPTQAILSSSKRLELPAFRYAGENCSQNEKKIVVGELLTRILWQLRLGLRNQVDPAGLGSTETRSMSAFHGLDFPLHYTKAQEAICLDQLLSQAHCLSTTNTKCYHFRKGFFGGFC